MTSATTSRTAATESQYANIFQRIRRRVEFLEGTQIQESDLPMRIVRHLIEEMPNWSKTTWTLYRCAVRFGFECALSDPTMTSPQSAYEEALKALNEQTQTHARRRGASTSALKARTISPGDLNKLRGYLFDHRKRQPLALQLIAFILASSATGLRPSEWANTELLEDAEGVARLRVKNAKTGHGRGNGSHRTLLLNGLDQIQLGCVRAMVAIAHHHNEQPDGYPAWQTRLRHYLARSSRAALGKRRQYPSLYTFRHQFAANAKATFSQEGVAALMGHASASTAGRNYAKRRQAKGGVGVTPLPAEVRTVRTPDSALFKLIRQNAWLR